MNNAAARGLMRRVAYPGRPARRAGTLAHHYDAYKNINIGVFDDVETARRFTEPTAWRPRTPRAERVGVPPPTGTSSPDRSEGWP